MIDPEVERSRVQPARGRSAADHATSPCRSSLDGIRPAILRFESQTSARKKIRGRRDRDSSEPEKRAAEAADEEEGAATDACCNQRSRADCRPPDDQRDADRLQTVTRRVKNEGTEPRLVALSVEEGPCSARVRSSGR